jgi:hypothetical protein
MLGRRSKRTQRRLEEHGRRAPATVLEIAERGMAITHGSDAIVGNTELAMKVRLRVEPEGEPSFEVETKLRFPQLAVPSQGSRLAVIYDPEDHEDIMLDDAPGARASVMPGLRPDQAESIRVAQEMAVAGRSPEEIRAAIDEIRAAAGQPPAQVFGGGVGGTNPPDPVAQLAKLAELRQSGMLDEAEFEAMKARILGGS